MITASNIRKNKDKRLYFFHNGTDDGFHLGEFDKEAVVTEVGLDDVEVGAHTLCHRLHVYGREEKVCAKGDYGRRAFNHLEGLFYASSATADVDAVHHIGQVPIGVGIEVADELAALIALVRGGLVCEDHIHGIFPLLDVVTFLAAIRHDGDAAGAFKAGKTALQVMAHTEGGIGLQGHALGLLEGGEPGGDAGGGGHEDCALNKLRVHYCKLLGMETTHGGAYKQVYFGNAQMLAKQVKRIDGVPYCYLGEIEVVGFTGKRIGAGRAAGPKAGTQGVGTDHEVLFGIEHKAGAGNLGPPITRIGTGSYGMAEPDNLLSVISAFGADIPNFKLRQHLPTFYRKRLIVYKNSFLHNKLRSRTGNKARKISHFYRDFFSIIFCYFATIGEKGRY